MKTYHIRVRETLERVVEVEAKNGKEAEKDIREAYRIGAIILTENDCSDLEINEVKNEMEIATNRQRSFE